MNAVRCVSLAVILALAHAFAFAQSSASSQPTLAKAPAPQEKPSALLPDYQPEVVTRVNPVYPAEAMKDSLDGTVFLSVVVDTSGRVGKITVMKSSNKVFDQPSIDAMKQWSFKPALRDGKPMEITIVVPFRYRLERGSKGK